MPNANKSHQNEAGRSHRPVAVYLMKLQEYCCEKKIHLKYFLRLYSLKKEHKIEKNKFKSLPVLF
jgi:hypothetical protein